MLRLATSILALVLGIATAAPAVAQGADPAVERALDALFFGQQSSGAALNGGTPVGIVDVGVGVELDFDDDPLFARLWGTLGGQPQSGTREAWVYGGAGVDADMAKIYAFVGAGVFETMPGYGAGFGVDVGQFFGEIFARGLVGDPLTEAVVRVGTRIGFDGMDVAEEQVCPDDSFDWSAPYVGTGIQGYTDGVGSGVLVSGELGMHFYRRCEVPIDVDIVSEVLVNPASPEVSGLVGGRVGLIFDPASPRGDEIVTSDQLRGQAYLVGVFGVRGNGFEAKIGTGFELVIAPSATIYTQVGFRLGAGPQPQLIGQAGLRYYAD